MGQEDDLHASLAHIVLGCVASRGISRISGKSFTHPGMHANFFIHSVLGFLHYNSGKLEKDFGPAYSLSYKATRYLALPSLMADIYTDNQNISAIYLVSGLVPFALAAAGNENPHLGNLCIVCNLISLAHYSMENNKEWGMYMAAMGVFTYFLPSCMGPKLIYPLGLALMEYCAYGMLLDNDFGPAFTLSYKATRYLALPCLMADLYSGNQNLSAIHLVSGIVPFALALTGKDNPHLGNLVIACNLISLAHYSMENNKEWGWYTAASGIFTYFLPPDMGPKLIYPLGLALMEYCAYRLFHNVYNDSPPPPPTQRGR